MNYANLCLDKNEYHKSLLDMLLVFDELCKENDMKYSLAGGTLLGAARHQGFIPWDDDVDVFLLRPDFDRFIAKYSDGEIIHSHYVISSMKTGLKEIPIARLIDMRVKVQHKTSESIPGHAWIDIVPLDAVPTDSKKATKLIKKLAKWREWRIIGNAKPGTGRGFYRRFQRTVYGKLLRKLRLVRPISKHIEKLAKKTPFEESEFLAEIVIKANYDGMTKREDFNNPVLLPFEGYRFMCMPDFHDYLSGQYGPDYMSLLPRDKRLAHGVKANLDTEYLTKEERKELEARTYQFK